MLIPALVAVLAFNATEVTVVKNRRLEKNQTVAKALYDASLDEAADTDSMTDEELARELNRRHEEYLRDPSVGIPLEEVKRFAAVGG